MPRGTAVELVDVATGARRRVELPDHADVLALSPDGSWLAAGAGHVTVVDCAHEPRTLAHTRVDPPLPDGLALDSEQARAVVWGVQGERADVGDGERFVRLCAVGEGAVTELWTGEGAPAEPNGFLLPLDGGSLGVYDGEGSW